MANLLRCYRHSGLVMYFSTLPAPSASAPCILAILTHLRVRVKICILTHPRFYILLRFRTFTTYCRTENRGDDMTRHYTTKIPEQTCFQAGSGKGNSSARKPPDNCHGWLLQCGVSRSPLHRGQYRQGPASRRRNHRQRYLWRLRMVFLHHPPLLR